MSTVSEAVVEKLKKMKEGQEDVISIQGMMFLISPATPADIERIARGSPCMD